MPGERCSQRLAQSVGVDAKRSIDEFPCRGGHSHGEFIGQGPPRWTGDLEVVLHTGASSIALDSLGHEFAHLVAAGHLAGLERFRGLGEALLIDRIVE